MPLSRHQRSFLLSAFASLAEALSLCPHGTAVPDELLSIYEEPGRYYHNASHLFHCLTELHETPPPLDPHIALAVWFHDVLYDSKRHNNEARSADLRRLYARVMRLRPQSILIAQRLILATDHRAPPFARDEALIMDIDLAILGQPPADFDAYERAIRQEYSHVPDDAFRAARADILRTFLARPTIYHTPRFRRRYESPARENLTRSLNQLTSE